MPDSNISSESMTSIVADPVHKIIIYQMMVRLFGNGNVTNKVYGSLAENGVGKFDDISDEAIGSLKDFGATHLWYTGILSHATTTDYSVDGINRDNPLIVKGKAGSPYAVKDYYDVDPDLAMVVGNRMSEFEALLTRTHKGGLKVIIDFIPNHVARQYHSGSKPGGVSDFGVDDDVSVAFKADNNFYYIPGQALKLPDAVGQGVSSEPYVEFPAKATGNDVFQSSPAITDWYETVKLNYGVDYLDSGRTYFDPIPSTWLKMLDILKFWTIKGVDGFRCDMAEMVPVEFWGWVIPEIKKINPNLIFIAEIYNPEAYPRYIFSGKFDYLYDKVGLYDTMRRLITGVGTVEDITRVWQVESGDFSDRMLRFLENHDEQRIASRFFANDPFLALPAMVLSATLHAGPVLYYFGQEVGVNADEDEGFQGNDGRTTIFDYWGIPAFQRWVNQGKFDGGAMTTDQQDLREFYQWLNRLVMQRKAISQGSFYDLQYANMDWQSGEYDKTRIYSYLRYSADQVLLFIFNFDEHKACRVQLRIPDHAWVNTLGLEKDRAYRFQEVFPENVLDFEVSGSAVGTEGLGLNLEPLSFYVMEIKEA